LKLISGHPLLVDEATQAAKACVFKPPVADGKTIKTFAVIDVRFKLR